jgi:photosystem II stability/assembly factor-like uncharacterized protein
MVSVVVNPKKSAVLYALSYGSYRSGSLLYRSTNSGGKWMRIATFSNACYHLAIDPKKPDNMYVLSSNSILKSTNGGSTWEEFYFGNYRYASYGQMCIDHKNPDTLYVSGRFIYNTNNWKSCAAVLKSTDAGETWSVQKIKPKSEYGTSRCLAMDPSNPNTLYAGVYYYTSSNYFYRLYKTTNGGKKWKDTTGSIQGEPQDIAIDENNSNKVYVANYWGLFRSSNGGNSWQDANGYVYGYAVAIDPANSNTIYAGYNKNCFVSTDGGVNFTEYSKGLAGTSHELFSSSGKLFMSTTAGVYQSTNKGKSWKAKNSGLRAIVITAMDASLSSPKLVYCEGSGNGFFKSTKYGKSFKRLPDFYRCEDIVDISVSSNNSEKLFILAGG